MIIWRIICVLSLSSVAWSIQEWARQPQPTKVLEGQDAVIACKVHNKVGIFEDDRYDEYHKCFRLVNVSGGKITD